MPAKNRALGGTETESPWFYWPPSAAYWCCLRFELTPGACERSVACSTCHVIIEPKFFDKLPEADDEENDMLDLAFGLEDT